ncbi:MAG: MFS transporter [Bacteroidales bacterium]|nr:MFS transporter [Bacteroidales bacterium]
MTEDKRYTRLRWQVFLSATVGYGIYYVCRLSLNVVKKPIVDSGTLTETELGIIGSALFITYAVGKFVNGFLADRVNIRRFMSLGLLVAALVNLLLGFHVSTGVFIVLWAINGWAQSMGAPAGVVAQSRWIPDKQRGRFYGVWSASHNIGEALTSILVAAVVSAAGWQWGFRAAGLLGLLGTGMLALLLRDSPQSCGLPSPDATVEAKQEEKSVWEHQKEVLRNPAIWMLALASAFMYISRYAVNSWGVFYLEAQRGYTTLEASSIISISSVCGIIGTVVSGFVSDWFFKGSRNAPAVIFGLMNVLGLWLFLFGPATHGCMIAAMVVFGLAIGALICYLGGLMAVDIASKKASGAALGVVGIASYLGAALQDFVSGMTIEAGKTAGAGYDFSVVSWFWLGAAILSVVFTLFVWYLTRKK